MNAPRGCGGGGGGGGCERLRLSIDVAVQIRSLFSVYFFFFFFFFFTIITIFFFFFSSKKRSIFFSLADLEPNTESVDQTNAGAECRVGGIALDVDLEYSSKKRINRSSERERERETIRIPWRLVSSSFFDEIRRPFVSLSLSLSLTRSDRCAKKRCKNHDVDVGKKQPNRCVFNSFAILGRLTTTTLSTATWFVEGEPRAHLHGNRPGRSGQRSPFF